MYIRVPARYALGQAVGPFEGTFTGTLDGDADTSATITAVLTHRDSSVQGKISLSSGLKLDFPGPTKWPDPCKLEPVDLSEFDVRGTSGLANPRHADVAGEADEPTDQFPALMKSMRIKITIAGDLSADLNTLTASVTLKPSMCGARKFDELRLTRK